MSTNKFTDCMEAPKVFLRYTLNFVSFIYFLLSNSHHLILKNYYGHSLLP